MVIVVGGVGSQPALGAGLTAIPRLVKAFDPRRNRLKELLDAVSLGVVKLSAKVRPRKSSEIAHPIDEKLRVLDTEVLFRFVKERFSGGTATIRRTSYVDGEGVTFRLQSGE